MREAWEFLVKGGPVMIPIILGSITALAILLERLWTLRRASVIPQGLIDRVVDLVRRERYRDALALCDQSSAPVGRVLRTCLRYRTLPRADLKAAVEDSGRRAVQEMSRLIEALSAIAAISPLLGLLGTVTGMIRAFQQVVAASAHGAVDPSQLASGIWEALITTAAGLCVAIPTYVAHRYLKGRAASLAREMERVALMVMDELHGVAAPTSADEGADDVTAEGAGSR
jgi:biopolymer transport protein ExbB